MAATNGTAVGKSNIGALVHLTPPEDKGHVWTATQSKHARNLPHHGAKPAPGYHSPADHHEIDWGLGPIEVEGMVDSSTHELSVSIAVAGIHLGNIHGNLENGVGINVNLLVAKGSIGFSLKNKNEVWAHVDIKIIFGGHFTGEHKILTI